MQEGNMKDLKPDTYFSTLIYGGSGSGKTTFCTTMPKPYLIVTEREPRGFSAVGKDVPYVKVDTYEELTRVLDEVVAGKRAADAQSICLDSLSDMTPLVTSYLLRKHNKDKMTLELWGIAVDYLRCFIRRFISELTKRAFTCVTALDTIDKDELTGEITGRVETIGRFALQVPALFDIVLHAKQDSVWNPAISKSITMWKVCTIKDGRFSAKDGIGFMDAEELCTREGRPYAFENILEKYTAKKAALQQTS